MKLVFLVGLILFGLNLNISLHAQARDPAELKKWDHSISLNFYLFEDPFTFIPIYEVNKGHLHLGARYNYEDHKTFSGWIGYNFMGGDDLTYVLTPMVGGLVGQTNAFAVGGIVQLDFRKFSFYSESEYVFDVLANSSDYFSDYFYTWTDISYSLADWLSMGMSVQKTRIYEPDADIQRGLLVRATTKVVDVTGYFYSPLTKEPFFVLTLSKDF